MKAAVLAAMAKATADPPPPPEEYAMLARRLPRGFVEGMSPADQYDAADKQPGWRR